MECRAALRSGPGIHRVAGLGGPTLRQVIPGPWLSEAGGLLHDHQDVCHGDHTVTVHVHGGKLGRGQIHSPTDHHLGYEHGHLRGHLAGAVQVTRSWRPYWYWCNIVGVLHPDGCCGGRKGGYVLGVFKVSWLGERGHASRLGGRITTKIDIGIATCNHTLNSDLAPVIDIDTGIISACISNRSLTPCLDYNAGTPRICTDSIELSTSNRICEVYLSTIWIAVSCVDWGLPVWMRGFGM